MIVDTSALVAVMRDEAEMDAFSAAIVEAGTVLMSAGNYLEAGIVMDRDRDPVVSARLDRFVHDLGIDIVPVTAAQARRARQAYRDFGKGSGHPARLNFGDCFAYALAMETGEPLLFKGDDFTHTGVAKAAAE